MRLVFCVQICPEQPIYLNENKNRLRELQRLAVAVVDAGSVTGEAEGENFQDGIRSGMLQQDGDTALPPNWQRPATNYLSPALTCPVIPHLMNSGLITLTRIPYSCRTVATGSWYWL